MRDLKDVACEIFNDTPSKLYILCGEEYGVKREYIEMLKRHYGDFSELSSVDTILTYFRTKHLIPPVPKLYIIRYDEDFVKSLNSGTSAMLDHINIIGTIVLVYEDGKHESALANYLPDYTTHVSTMHEKFIKKHLLSLFPDRMAEFIEHTDFRRLNYSEAYNLVLSASSLPDTELYSEEERNLVCDLSPVPQVTSDEFAFAFANKDFSSCAYIIQVYTGNLTDLFYSMCSVLIDLEAALSEPNRAKSRKYGKSASKWNLRTVVTMFDMVYNHIKSSRTDVSMDMRDTLLYLSEMSLQVF